MILYDSHIPLTNYAHQLDEELVPFDGRNLTKKDILASGARALFIRSVTKIDQSLIAGTQLRFIGTCTAGYEHVDVQSLRNKGIAFAHAPGSNAMPVVEYVLTALHEWQKKTNVQFPNLTIGIIGMGQIGTRVAMMCRLLGMRVLASDPPLESYGKNVTEGVEWVSLNTLFMQSNCISVHAAMNTHDLFPTKNLIKEYHCSLMKSSSLFIHAARGGMVDEHALLKAMNDSDIHVAIDVWKQEPSWNRELADHPRTIMATPHIAGYTEDARKRGIDMIVQAYCNLMDKQFTSQSNDMKGISVADPKAVNLIKERRFGEQKILWLQGKEGNVFDEGRRTFMHDLETLSDIMLM